MPLSIPQIVGIVVALLIVGILASGYVKSPPDMCYVISGLGKPKILIGKAGIKIPFIERKDTLTLRQLSIDIKKAKATYLHLILLV